MSTSFLSVTYLVAGVLFILSLGGLASQETARRGNLFGIIGMIIAVIATLLHPAVEGYALVLGAVVIGGGIGALMAARVAMTAMPQLVAILHSFVGLAAVLVGVSSYLAPLEALDGAAHAVHLIEIWLAVAIGAITFTGSIIAWGKLRGSISGKPLVLPSRHKMNAAALASVIVLMIPFLFLGGTSGLPLLIIMAVIAGLLGIHLVMAIGGADMPVVVSLLNSYSGWAAAAAGFMLSNDLLIVTGALVGSSGAILSYIMCKAMNRSIWNVVFGGFGSGDAPKPTQAQIEGMTGTVTETTAEEVADLAANATGGVIIVPGYGMAVGRAQHLVNEFTQILREQGVDVRYGIHPVAGRLPGHMNVLLAEAGVPYDIVLEMEELNHDFPKTDLVLVIGANDIVNPGAETDEHSPIYGMPVLQVWKSTQVVVLKRGMGAGYAGVGNPLFLHDNTDMLFGDAKVSMQAVVGALRER